jgi:recombination protein RecR
MNDDPIRTAIAQLRRLPGVGEKSATRLVYWLLRAPTGTASDIANALSALGTEVRTCSVCCDLGPTDPCGRCRSDRRADQICVVETPVEVLAIERSGEYRGRYHVLHGALSPLDGVGPDALRVRELLHRLRDGAITEVILATNPTVEGDATALYLARLLGPIGVRVTRLAHGLSVGSAIEHADAVSLARALANRREVA